MTEIKTVTIIGGGGNVGSAILRRLLASNLQVKIITRPNSNSTFPSSANVVKVDYDRESLTAAFQGQDAVVLCLSISALRLGIDVVDAAVAAGVKWFLPSEYGNDPTDERIVDLLPITKVKTSIVAHLKEKEREGLSWTGVITGLFFDWCLDKKFLGFDFENRTAEFWDDGKSRFTTVNLDSIALAVVNLLTSPDALAAAKNKYIYISSVTTSQLEILTAIEQVTGEKWKVNRLDSEAVVADAKEKASKGERSGLVRLIQRPAFGKDDWSNFSHKAEEWNALLGLDGEETVEETVRRVLKKRDEKV